MKAHKRVKLKYVFERFPKSNVLVVHCCIDHAISSNVNVPELFKRIRPRLITAARKASQDKEALCPHESIMGVGIAIGEDDPMIYLSIYDSALFLSSIDANLDYLQDATEKLIQREKIRES